MNALNLKEIGFKIIEINKLLRNKSKDYNKNLIKFIKILFSQSYLSVK